MALGTFKTLMNVGMHISNDHAVPVTKSIQKTKNYEIRLYEKNKYIALKYKNKEFKTTTAAAAATDNGGHEHEKKAAGDDGSKQVMSLVWKIMKYTQGENESATYMKLYMPVFVHVQTISETDTEREFEVKILVSLPPDYQELKSDPDKVPLQPPKPNDADIYFEVLDEFKAYVRNFSGFADDDMFKKETHKLKENLKEDGLNIDEARIICISYDPPYKLFGRRNEVICISA